jgi:hypothetical protein
MPYASYSGMSHDSETGQISNDGKNYRVAKEIIILSSILVSLLILVIRPFGFRTFLHGLQHDSIFSLFLVTSIVGVVLVIMQRLGLIFPDPKGIVE